MALLTILILLWSKKGAIRSPQPHWPLAPSPRPFLTVESPIRKRVGSLGLSAGAGEVVWERAMLNAPSSDAMAAGKAPLSTRCLNADEWRWHEIDGVEAREWNFCLDMRLFLRKRRQRGQAPFQTSIVL